ncbi:MAG TPA: response regulator transcription factor [Gelria sp.]|nr:response regulator transcription factor [Gelria sp.]
MLKQSRHKGLVAVSVKILIVDDDERDRIILRYVLEQIKGVEIVGEAVHGLEALMLCQEKEVDLVFLDINMPEMDGLETARKLKQLKNVPLFAFITINKDLAVDAFELEALDYIVKPIEQNRIELTIERARQHLGDQEIMEEMINTSVKERINFILDRYNNYGLYSDKLPVREKGKISLLNQNDIVFCESQGKKVYICTYNEGFLSNYTLNELEKRLNSINFFRAHQAYIVNLNYITEILNLGDSSYVLHLENCDKDIILSRSKAKLLRQRLGI